MRYRLDELGWHQFEELCQSLLKVKYGDAVESWGGSRDIGRDAFCNRPIELIMGVQSSSPIVFQVKFVIAANAAGSNWKTPLLAAIRKEASLLRERADKRKTATIREYVLITNAPLDVDSRDDIQAIVTESLENSGITLFSGNDVCGWLDDNPRIRWSFPQLVSIRDIQLLIDDRQKFSVNKVVLERSSIQLELARKQAEAFVPTTTYRRTLQKLDKHNFAVLSGAPEVGKTTIARMVALNAYFLGWKVYEVQNPEEMLGVIERNGKHAANSVQTMPRQLFIADDAFGTTEYDEDFARQWSKDLDKIVACLDSKHWMIWTSRSAPLTHALNYLRLQGPAEHFPDPAKIVVDATELTTEEKALILYRHAKRANLAAAARSLLKTHAYNVVSDPHFTPERIRRFVQTDLAKLAQTNASSKSKKRSEAIASAIAKQLKDPTKAMRQSFECLSEHRQLFLVSLLDCGGHSISKKEAHESFLRIFGDQVDRQPLSIAEELDEQFIQLVSPPTHNQYRQPEKVYEWVHPSWRDLVINHLIEHRLTRQRFLNRCSLNGIVLALSSGGGIGGERNFPLVVETADWQCLTENVVRLIPNLYGKDLARLLRLAQTTYSNHPAALSPDVGNFCNVVLTSSIDAWTQGRTFATIDALRIVYSLSSDLEIVIQPPLRSIWRAAFNEIVQTCVEGCDFEPLADDFNYLAELIELTQQKAPDLYHRLHSESLEARRIIDLAVTTLQREAQTDYETWGYDDETMETCKERFEQCATDLAVVLRFAPEFSTKIDQAIRDCRKYAKAITERQEEADLEDAEETDDEDISSPPAAKDQTSAHNRQPDTRSHEEIVADLFADL